MTVGCAGALVMLGTLVFGDVLETVAADFKANAVSSSVVLVLPLTALVVFGSLVFYGFRLEARQWKRRRGDAALDLRMTRVLAGSVLVIGLIFLGGGQVGDSPLVVWPVMLASAAWAAACCWLLLEARRAEWALAAARGASLTAGPGHGFQVLLPTAAAPAVPGASPGAAAPHGASPLPAAPAHVMPVAYPAAPASAGREPAANLGHWEVVLLLLVLIGVALHLLPAAPKSFVLGNTGFSRSGFNEMQMVQVSLVRTGLAQAALPLLLLLVLLTRPQMHSLFAARPRRPRASGAVG